MNNPLNVLFKVFEGFENNKGLQVDIRMAKRDHKSSLATEVPSYAHENERMQ